MDSTTEDTDTSFKAPLSIAPTSKKTIPDLNYEEPEWSGAPDSSKYELEVLKNGVIIESYPLSGKNFFVLGRLPTVDIPQEHPSLSRHHAVIQYRPGSGFFLFDLDSAHGTFHNKRRVIPRTYVPLRVGHSIKLAGSTRLLLLQGPEDDSEPEIPMEVVKEHIAKKKAVAEEDDLKEPEGISWGMREDAIEETEGINIISQSETPLDLDDPKKTLRNWFEREGYELEYKVEEKGHSSFICSIDLPTETGEPLIAEVKAGKKKEAVIQCALEACRMLDRRGLLRTSSAASKRKSLSKNWEEMDYYDSDDDEFLDRTGNIQEKRLKRMKLANKTADTVDTHDSLKEKLALVESEKAKVQSELDKSKANVGSEDLDDYINSLNGGAVDKHTIDKLKAKLNELKRESMRLSKLIEITKPSDVSVPKESTKKFLPGGVMIGKRSRLGMIGKTRMIAVPKKEQKDDGKVVEDQGKSEDSKDDKVITKESKPNQIDSTSEKSQGKGEAPKDEKVLIKDSKPDTIDTSSEKSSESYKSTEKTQKDNSISVKNEKKVEKEEAKKKKKTENKQSDPKKQETTPSICDEGKIEGNYSSSLSDPKYATWVPPANQTGDGRTSLNDKYGY